MGFAMSGELKPSSQQRLKIVIDELGYFVAVPENQDKNPDRVHIKGFGQ